MKLELIPIPVGDVELAKAYYVDKLGFAEDVDVQPSPGARFVQLTPQGSSCSIVLGTDLGPITGAPPGSLRGVHLVVPDMTAARDELAARGVEVGDVQDVGGGVKLAELTDPDGNTLLLQEMPWRTGEAF